MLRARAQAFGAATRLALLALAALTIATEPARALAQDGAAPAAPPAVFAPPEGPAAAALDRSLQVLTRVVTCQGEAPLPEALPRAVHEAHCQAFERLVAYYRRHWLAAAEPFLAALVPSDPPEIMRQVVYPFGGGDLITALATFPQATTLTSLSLEASGDIRRLGTLSEDDWAAALADLRLNLQHLFAVSHSKTVNLRKGAKAALPGEIAFALVALAVHGFEPVSLRYVRWTAEGALVSVDAPGAEVSAASSPDPFAHIELVFRPRGGGPLRVYRHFAANLEDSHLRSATGLMAFLEAQGRVAALVKAASYLLWSPAFSYIRSYLLTHADWMISDSTGVPPSLAAPAGFTQEVWGAFHGTIFPVSGPRKQEMLALWAGAPLRPLPMMFGYPDDDGHAHLMVTRRTGARPSPESARTPWDEPANGFHWRLSTTHGPVHVWHPRGLSLPEAGLVIYVHGLYTKADEAFAAHRLPFQFAASRLNAVFVVPEAPTTSSENVVWSSLPELRQEVAAALPGLKPQGALVLVGHSGAYRTLAGWLDEPDVNSLILLDALYGEVDRFSGWLARVGAQPGAHLTLVTNDTTRLTEEFLRGVPGAVRLPAVPARFDDLPPEARTAAVLEMRAPQGHMQIVTQGKVIPVVLQRAPVPSLPRP